MNNIDFRERLASVQIGTLNISPATFLAPIAEITDQPFRQIVRSFGGVGAMFTEMISSDAYTRECERTMDMVRFSESERPLFFQIVGKDPRRMADAAAMAQAAGADAVDINMGCPSSTITRHGSGSALLRDLKLSETIVSAVRQAISIPLTIKIRSGWNQDSLRYIDFGAMAERQGVDAIFFHGRTRAEMFSGHVHTEHIARLKSRMSIPVIGNGDIQDRESLNRMLSTKCDGIMIARAAIKKPWIFAELINGAAFSPADLVTVMRRHFSALKAVYSEKLVLHRMKTFAGWYSRSLPDGKKLRVSLSQVRTVAEMDILIDRYLEQINSLLP